MLPRRTLWLAGALVVLGAGLLVRLNWLERAERIAIETAALSAPQKPAYPDPYLVRAAALRHLMERLADTEAVFAVRNPDSLRLLQSRRWVVIPYTDRVLWEGGPPVDRVTARPVVIMVVCGESQHGDDASVSVMAVHGHVGLTTYVMTLRKSDGRWRVAAMEG